MAAEAKHSFAILMSILGVQAQQVMGILVKYPDAVDALVNNDQKKFSDSMSILIVLPIKVIADAFCDICNDDSSKILINDIMSKSKEDPIGAKNSIIKICNVLIFKMNKERHRFEEIKELP